MAKFRKKPVEIEARQYLGDESKLHDVYLWVESKIGSIDPDDKDKQGVSIDPATGRMFIRTLEGDMYVSLGDFVIEGVQGEFYPCKPDIFAATYDPAPELGLIK